MEMNFNSLQSTLQDIDFENLTPYVRDSLLDTIATVPLVKALVSPDRRRAKDMPKDEEGKVIVDFSNPHIIEDMDYFRPSALHFMKHGKYTNFLPSSNPNSPFMKWLTVELDRCYNGMVRESDGEWITGDYYYFLNYSTMNLVQTDEKTGVSVRATSFPSVWEGHYLLFHYFYNARKNGNHAGMLGARGKGKSFIGASLLSKRFLIGEFVTNKKNVDCYVTASDKKYLDSGDQILNKFVDNLSFAGENTEFPRSRITDSLSSMKWISGYKDINSGSRKGTGNTVTGITCSDNPSALRGTRGALYIFEESGTFNNLLELFSNTRWCTEEGDNRYGIMFFFGTAGDKDSDFLPMQELMYNGSGYNVHMLENCFDKQGSAKDKFVFFFPAYLNLGTFFNKDGVSDVIASLTYIFKDREQVRDGSSSPSAITKRIAEFPVVPQEAVLRVDSNIFPVGDIRERIRYLQSEGSGDIDAVSTGDLVLTKGGVDYRPSENIPIRDFPYYGDNKKGSIEFYEHPVRNSLGEVDSNRYVIGHDPVDDDTDDEVTTESLSSTFVFDMYTDNIVAEYTGRHSYADENYEVVIRLCQYYNARIMYESNKKGLFSYCSQRNLVYLLEDTPTYLKDRSMIKHIGIGNRSKGVVATQAVNKHANDLIARWLVSPFESADIVPDKSKELNQENSEEDAQDASTFMNKVHTVKSLGLLRELLLYTPELNVDRIRALGMVMIAREERLILSGGKRIAGRQKSEYNKFSDLNSYFDEYDKRFPKEEEVVIKPQYSL